MLPLIAAAGSFLGSSGLGAGIASAIGGLAGNASAAGAARDAIRAERFNYKHRYQWQVEDMQKAGLNPMLSALNFSAPSAGNVPVARTENVGSQAVASALQARALKLQGDLVESQVASNVASARESGARTEGQLIGNKIAAESVPYSAGTAARNYEIVSANARKAGNEVAKLAEELLIKKQERVQNEDLMPLALEYQRYMNESARLGLTEQRAEEMFWEQAGAAGKWAGKIRDLVPSFPKGIFKKFGGK